jgi:hypothetical protein
VLYFFIVPKAKIHSNREIYIKSGNDINLTCSTNEFTSPPSFIYWYKGLKVINYSQRGGINVSTDRSTKTSNLIIKHATHPADSGNYTCAPSNSGKKFTLFIYKTTLFNFISSIINQSLALYTKKN